MTVVKIASLENERIKLRLAQRKLPNTIGEEKEKLEKEIDQLQKNIKNLSSQG